MANSGGAISPGWSLPYGRPSTSLLVGSHFNVTMAGVHLDGLLKNEEIYNIFDTRKLLKIPPGVAVNDKSGVAGILHWIKVNLDVPKGDLTKSHPGIAKIKDWVVEQYAKGRVTTISDEEMMEQTRKHLPELFELPQEAVESLETA